MVVSVHENTYHCSCCSDSYIGLKEFDDLDKASKRHEDAVKKQNDSWAKYNALDEIKRFHQTAPEYLEFYLVQVIRTNNDVQE